MATAPASPAATGSCGRSSSPRDDLRARAARSTRGERGGAGAAPGPGPVRAARGPAATRPKRSAWRPPPTVPAGSYCWPRSCGRRGRGRAGALGLGARPPPGGDRGQRCRGAAGGRAQPVGGAGRRGGDDANRPAPGRAAPTSPPRRCRCWRWGRAPTEPAPGGAAAATLGLTRAQALRLIAAESFARKLTLLPARLSDGRRASGTWPSWRARCAPAWSSGAAPRRRRGARPAATCARRCASWSTRRRRCSAPPTARRSRRGSSATASASARSRTCSPIPRSRR